MIKCISPCLTFCRNFLFLKASFLIASVGLLLTTPVATADSALQQIIDKYSAEVMGDAIARHAVYVTSESGIEQIPSAYLYRAAFLRLILNADSSRQHFSDSDWALITELPDHIDPQFQTPNIARLKANCGQIRSIRSRGNAQSAKAMAAIASDAERKLINDLEMHYTAVMESLSVAGREKVEVELKNLPEVYNLSWSNIDLVGLSEEIPEYVEMVVTQSCEQIASIPTPTAERRLLRDAPTRWTRQERQ